MTAELVPKNITLPNYPEGTTKFDGCHWIISSSRLPIKLVFRTFDLTPVDYITISDASKKHTYEGDRILMSPKFYGLNPPPPVIYSMSGFMIVHLNGKTLQNPSRRYSGFLLEYSTYKSGENRSRGCKYKLKNYIQCHRWQLLISFG